MDKRKAKGMKTKSGKLLHPVALGTLYFGTGIPVDEAQALLDLYVEKGGNQIDTARSYASWMPGGDGASERTIGDWLARQRQQLRADLFIGTKGGLRERGYNCWRCELGEEAIKTELEESLSALHTDYIDLYWLHRDNEEIPAGRIVEMMNRLIRTGKIRYYGLSNWRTVRIREAMDYADKHGLRQPSASQIQYGFGICTREAWGDSTIVCMNAEEYEAYQKLHIPVYAYSAQSEGYFAILLEKGAEALGESVRKKYDCPENRDRAKRLNEILKRPFYRDLPMALVSPEYIFRSPFPTVVIQGGTNRTRLSQVMDYGAEPMQIFTEDEWRFILKGRAEEEEKQSGGMR